MNVASCTEQPLHRLLLTLISPLLLAGLTDAECELCPRGKYGDTEGLKTKQVGAGGWAGEERDGEELKVNTNPNLNPPSPPLQCSANCPAGRYYDERGAETVDDCLYCPPGKFGPSTGYTTRECGGNCPAGKYSSVSGLVTDANCAACPTGYRGWQCDWVLDPRKGFFTSTSGKINEAGHAYLDATNGRTGQANDPTTHPDGEWSADRYAGDYSGAWYNGEVAGAYPSNSWLRAGKPDGNYDPASAPRSSIATIAKIPSNKDP